MSKHIQGTYYVDQCFIFLLNFILFFYYFIKMENKKYTFNILKYKNTLIVVPFI